MVNLEKEAGLTPWEVFHVHSVDFLLRPKGSHSMRGFKQESDMIQFSFQKDLTEGIAENRFKGAQLQAGHKLEITQIGRLPVMKKANEKRGRKE